MQYFSIHDPHSMTVNTLKYIALRAYDSTHPPTPAGR